MHRHTPEAPSFGILKQIRPGRNRQHRNLRPFPHSLAPELTLGLPPRTSQRVASGLSFFTRQASGKRFLGAAHHAAVTVAPAWFSVSWSEVLEADFSGACVPAPRSWKGDLRPNCASS